MEAVSFGLYCERLRRKGFDVRLICWHQGGGSAGGGDFLGIACSRGSQCIVAPIPLTPFKMYFLLFF